MARPCLALLRNLNDSLEVVDKTVRNFDRVSYYNGRDAWYLLFFMGVNTTLGFI